MRYFKDILSEEDLKAAYRRLVMMYHPDRGGDCEIMKRINYEYAWWQKAMKFRPKSLDQVKLGCFVYVNNSKCVVTKVEKDSFKAMSLKTRREAYFSKSTGYAMLNFKFKAHVDAIA